MKNLIKSLSTRTGVIRLSMAVVIGLIVLKVIVSIISNSISIAAQAADSFLDILSIVITSIALQKAAAPADEEHPFGHSKAEGLAAMIQAILVIGAGGYIVFSAIQRIIHRTVIEPDEGMIVMIISIIASFFLSRHLHRVAKETGSTAIDASARNISADVYSASGVFLGLLMVRITDLVILDPIIALIMAGFVLKAGYEVTMRAFHELIDYALPEEEQEILITCLNDHKTYLVDFHAIRSRRAGSERFVDLHLVTPRYYTIERAHSICDHLERDIKDKIANANVIIHAEPCNSSDCKKCFITVCEFRRTA